MQAMDNSFDDVTPVYNRAPGDNVIDTLTPEERNSLAPTNAHPLDNEENRKLLRMLLEWYYYEREKQAPNRLEMALDADFYDNLQWDPDDANEVLSRGQMPLVYNEIAPMCDWVIGTERRSRVDWKVLPRTEDDVENADIKTKVLKYLQDVNKVTYNRSAAFADAIKAGVGWVDNGVRDDPTKEIIYHKREDWRNVLHDSAAYELDLDDGRYLFRWRWVDEDIAVMMFPDRENIIRMAVEETQHQNVEGWEEDTWQTGYEINNTVYSGRSGTIYASGVGHIADAKRRRVKLIECQYKMPVRTKIIGSGPLKGAFFDERDVGLINALNRYGGHIIDKMMMRTHVAVFTESHLLAKGVSFFRHNKFSLTPIWCYRRGRDRLPYGMIRRVRDIQQDLNKRASKALFLLNTNQVIYEKGAVDDEHQLRDEADRPDGMIAKNPGKSIEIRRDTEMTTGQISMMTLAAQSIQKIAGVTDENMGRRTNAVSGKAIEARQTQGGVVTTEPFDNLRYATQVDGEKLLSLSEQFLTEERVIRLTGNKGQIQWQKINVPEQMEDGSVRFLNDITSSMADFVVSEQDYAGTLRQVMFDAISQIAGRVDPQVGLRLMTIAMEFSDLPNHEEIADAFRKITGDRDPDKPMSPEEQQQQQQAMMMQAEAMENQRKAALLALQEQSAKVRELNAKAAKMEAEAMMQGQGDQSQAVMEFQRKAADELDRMAEELRKAQSELSNRKFEAQTEADAVKEKARIEADSAERVAEIQAASNERIKRLEAQMKLSFQPQQIQGGNGQ